MTRFFRKIPGFRSGSPLKGLVASIFYLIGLNIIFALLFPGAPTLALDKIEPTNKSSVTVSGKTLANKPVYLFKDNQQIQAIIADSKGQFYLPLNDLTDGNYTYVVKACHSDKQDKCKTENILLLVDQTPPSKPLIALPATLPDDSSEKITITGTAEPDTKIVAQLNEDQAEEAVTNSQGEFALTTNLAIGSNTISIKSFDQVGNESKAAVSVLKFDPKTYVVKVARVVDGDTIKLESGEVVRYIGIDTPETVDPRKPVQCYGKEASAKNRELVEGKEVKLEKDVSNTDKYNRLLRYIWLDNTLINELLVREGYAKSSTYPPDVKYQDRFVAAEQIAREENKGLWGGVCTSPSPVPVKTTTPTQPTTTPAAPSTYVAPTTQTQPVQPAQPAAPTSGAYTCNCSKTCPNMSSCAEAQYQLNTCGCTARDADHDGIACDSDCQ